MSKLEAPVYYKKGVSGVSTCIGYEDKSNRVVRFKFKTGSNGATSISISVSEGTIINYGGEELKSIPFYITTSDTSYKNANVADGFSAIGYITGSSGKKYSGNANVVLKADTTYYLWFFPKSKTYGFSCWYNSGDIYYTDVTLKGTSKHKLTIFEGIGSSITVNRTSSKVGLSKGDLSNNDVIYNNDSLKITFTADENYNIKEHTVNNVNFTSGNTYIVSGDVYVASTANPLSFKVSATDADIESTSIITVTQGSSDYTYTLEYSFVDLVGTIPIETSNNNNVIPWTIPIEFYEQIKNKKTEECTITCTTYNKDEQIGSHSCTIKVTASSLLCTPSVIGTVVDINDTTRALTGGEDEYGNTILIRNKSTAECTIEAYGKNSSDIIIKMINKLLVGDKKIFYNVSDTKFKFDVIDSRTYGNSVTIEPIIIDYIEPTCNPILTRPTPSGNSIVLDVNGNFYRGSFGQIEKGAKSNTLTIEFRYAESDEIYGDWQEIDMTHIIYGTSSYRSENSILLGNNFDYRLDYNFEVRVKDGADGYVLSTITKKIPVSRGIPVCDWGKDDFNFNVPIMLNNKNIFNYIYPIGAVYMHNNSTLPTEISSIGTWESVITEVDGIYVWERIE